MKNKKTDALVEFYKRMELEMAEQRGLFSKLEMEAEVEKARVGKDFIDERLRRLEPENDRPKACPLCGASTPLRAKGVERTIKSLSGIHTFKRNYYYCRGCKHGFYPQDYMLGLPEEGDVSVELEKRILDFAINDVYESSAERWALHYRHLPFSRKQFYNVANRVGLKAEEANPDLLQASLLPGKIEPTQTTYVLNDGGMVSTRPDWREVKLGMVFRSENHLPGTEEKRGIISSARYVAQLGSQEVFKEQMAAAFRMDTSFSSSRVAYLADGAPGNWAIAETVCPTATQILDWYHAVENAMTCGKAVLGEKNSVGLEFWEAGMKCLLANGATDLLITTLLEFVDQTSDAGLEALNGFIGYVRNNQSRMHYKKFREQGFIIGSGPIESAHRHVIQTRMKKAGQHWSVPGASRMAHLRAAYRTAGPERFHESIHWAYRETVRNRRQLDQIARRRKPPKRRASNR